MTVETPHPLYTGDYNNFPPILVEEDGKQVLKQPIKFQLKRPDGPDGKERDQTNDAAEHMRYAATLGLPQLAPAPRPKLGRAIIVGGGPSVKDQLETIRELSKDKNNIILAINWTHTWLIQNDIIPRACVFFEIDAEPDTVLKAAHPEVTYLICSHCHPRSFDTLKGFARVLWHSNPNSPPEEAVANELFPEKVHVGGGISTFSRTMTIALWLGYRHLDLFGCDSSFPEQGKTHVEGYETIMDNKTDGLDLWAKSDRTGEVKKFRTVGYLALQAEEFKIYCEANHQFFSMKVYGDSLLRWVHSETYPDQYV